jgi:hypothetical protein
MAHLHSGKSRSKLVSFKEHKRSILQYFKVDVLPDMLVQGVQLYGAFPFS